MRRVVAPLALNALTVAACVVGGHSQDTSKGKPNISMPPSASRGPAPVVKPVEHNGIRYAQDSYDLWQGDQQGGYLVALDAETGARQWRLKVYEVTDSGPGAPQGIGAIYFRAMRLVTSNVLEIENEGGGVYHVNLDTRAVTQVAGPPPTDPNRPVKPAKPKPTPPG
jgi:hypothetical protein